MAFRRCPVHGWQSSFEWEVDPDSGEQVCGECGRAVTGKRPEFTN